MPRKQRDYKAEYQARKRKATQLGYTSEREYKRARKALATPRRQNPLPKAQALAISPTLSIPISRIRRASQRWSDAHSRVINSQYDPSMTDDQARRYWRAFVEDIPGVGKSKSRQKEKRNRIHDYLVPDIMDEKEWTGKYVPQP